MIEKSHGDLDNSDSGRDILKSLASSSLERRAYRQGTELRKRTGRLGGPQIAELPFTRLGEAQRSGRGREAKSPLCTYYHEMGLRP